MHYFCIQFLKKYLTPYRRLLFRPSIPKFWIRHCTVLSNLHPQSSGVARILCDRAIKGGTIVARNYKKIDLVQEYSHKDEVKCRSLFGSEMA